MMINLKTRIFTNRKKLINTRQQKRNQQQQQQQQQQAENYTVSQKIFTRLTLYTFVKSYPIITFFHR